MGLRVYGFGASETRVYGLWVSSVRGVEGRRLHAAYRGPFTGIPRFWERTLSLRIAKRDCSSNLGPAVENANRGQ